MKLRLELSLFWYKPSCFSHVNDAVLMLIGRNLFNKSSEASINTRSTPVSLSFKCQATKHTTVKRLVGTKFSSFTPHRGGTTISLETKPWTVRGEHTLTSMILLRIRDWRKTQTYNDDNKNNKVRSHIKQAWKKKHILIASNWGLRNIIQKTV